jgi:glutamate-1-semialdehyde 2,1-aminomutase
MPPVRRVGPERPRLGSPRALELRERAHALIPGGAHTYAKGDDQYPELAPTFVTRGKGCRVWDVDGNEFIEYGMGLRAVTLGHGYEEVVEAAHRQMLLGSNYTRPATIEVECAEALLELIPRADMVKFCKDGSTANTAAVTLARAYTGRDLVAICADHPFFSYNDWFIGTTAMNAGIPRVIQELTLRFRYNDLESAEALFVDHPDRIACVILEAERTEEPRGGFLHGLQDLCARNGALLILDEMITGFRWHLGGAQEYYDLTPDLSTFGKAMANGFSVSALVGKREIMELGGLRHSGERVFLLSTTHGAENHALAAAIATMRIYQEQAVVEGLHERGERLRRGIESVVRDLGLEAYFQVAGKAPNLVYVTRECEGKPSPAFRTLFLQETIERGFIMPSLVVSFSHGDEEIDRTVEAIREALVVYAKALEEGIERHLQGRSVQPVYRRFN